MTEKLKPAWFYFPHKTLSLVALHWPNNGDNRVSIGAGTIAPHTDQSAPVNSNAAKHLCENIHYDDVTMGAMASQITSLTIVYSTVYSSADQRKHQNSAPLVTGEFPAQMAVNAENVLSWWRHHVIA